MYEQRLRQFPLFSVLPQSEIRNLVNSLQVCDFERSTLVIKEGEQGENYYILMEGGCTRFGILSRRNEPFKS